MLKINLSIAWRHYSINGTQSCHCKTLVVDLKAKNILKVQGQSAIIIVTSWQLKRFQFFWWPALLEIRPSVCRRRDSHVHAGTPQSIYVYVWSKSVNQCVIPQKSNNVHNWNFTEQMLIRQKCILRSLKYRWFKTWNRHFSSYDG